jgi:hypothetical protein
VALDSISGAEPSTVTFKARTFTQNQNSTLMHQEIITLGGIASTLALAQVLDGAPASTEFGLVTRQVGYVAPSTTVSVAAMPAGSTTVSVAALPANSSQVEVRALPSGMLSTAAPASNDTGLTVRQVDYVAPSTTVTVAAMPAGSTTVTISGNSTAIVRWERPGTATRSSLVQSSTSVTAQASNANRLGWTCFNNPTQGSFLFLKYGTTASTTDFDVRIAPFGYFELPQPCYTGRIDAVWDSTGAGYARIVEFSA